jgi:hypothetical protein
MCILAVVVAASFYFVVLAFLKQQNKRYSGRHDDLCYGSDTCASKNLYNSL